MNVKEVREALERLNRFTYHAADNRDAEDIKTVCAALSTINPEAIRAEARAEALKEVKGYKELLQWADDRLGPEINPSNYDHQDVCELNANVVEVGLAIRKALSDNASYAILADEPKKHEAEETDIDFVEPTSRDMQIADEVRMCKLGVGAAMRVAKYRIEVECKIKEADGSEGLLYKSDADDSDEDEEGLQECLDRMDGYGIDGECGSRG